MREKLMQMAEEEYAVFHRKLCPGTANILGVRIPDLRKLAKETAKGEWRKFLEQAPEYYYEETMLKGMTIGYAKMDLEERLKWIAWFVPKIDNWAVCDCFCSGLKALKKDLSRVFSFLQPYRTEEREFSQRFFAVMLMDYFVEEEWVEKTLILLDKTKHQGYYTKMGVAWALSICFIKFPKETMAYLQGGNSLDDFTFNKAISKMTDSYRVNQETKAVLRAMRRPPTTYEASIK